MRKSLILIFLFTSFLCEAQDWKSVRMDDTTYYTIPAANDYLRVIWIDSATTAGTDSIFHFYPSIRLGNTTTNCLDTLGPTWLGKNFIKKANGDELYFNRWLDTIILKPQSVLNTTWVMHADTANNEYRATVTALNALTIDQQQDSIKEITITVFNNNTVQPAHIHHNKKIVLSKNHGFVDCLEWYGFPDANGFSINEILTSSSDIHSKLPKRINYSAPSRIDTSKAFHVGSERHYEYKKSYNLGTFTKLWIDSVISRQALGADSIILQVKHKYFSHWRYIISTNPTVVYKDSFEKYDLTKFDTLYLGNPRVFQDYVRPEHNDKILFIPPNISNGIYFNNYYFKADTSACFDYILESTYRNSPVVYMSSATSCPTLLQSVSGVINHSINLMSSFGILDSSQVFTSPNNSSDEFNLIYYKNDSCSWGNPLNYILLSEKTRTRSPLDINIYPNPANNKIFFRTEDKSVVLSAKLFSVLGKQIGSYTNCNFIETSNFTNGLYILHVETSKGIIRKKILIQH